VDSKKGRTSAAAGNQIPSPADPGGAGLPLRRVKRGLLGGWAKHRLYYLVMLVKPPRGGIFAGRRPARARRIAAVVWWWSWRTLAASGSGSLRSAVEVTPGKERSCGEPRQAAKQNDSPRAGFGHRLGSPRHTPSALGTGAVGPRTPPRAGLAPEPFAASVPEGLPGHAGGDPCRGQL